MRAPVVHRLLAALFVVGAVAAAPPAWAADPTAVDAGPAGSPFHVVVTPGTWQVDGANGTVGGAGSLDLVVSGTTYPLTATWTGATFDPATNALTAGTIGLMPTNGPIT